MKNLILAPLAALLLCASCVSTPYMVETEGAFTRTTERVIERHDAYVEADESLSDEAEADALAESATLVAYLSLAEVSGSTFASALEPVADRHDEYVSADASLDPLERDIYLEDTERLESLLSEAAEHEPGN